VTWTSRNKRKSVYMRKPTHYLVYQLALDIDAHTGICADTHQLTLYGREMQPFQRLSSCNVEEGDVVQLTQRTTEQQEKQQPQLSKRAKQLLEELMPASGALAVVPEEEDECYCLYGYDIQHLMAQILPVPSAVWAAA
jgi:type VI protein secretion system component VasK